MSEMDEKENDDDESPLTNVEKSHKLTEIEDDPWISGEELYTEESTDEEDGGKVKSPPKKNATHTARSKGQRIPIKLTDDKPDGDRAGNANVRSMRTSVRHLHGNVVPASLPIATDRDFGADINWNETDDTFDDTFDETFDETPSWRPKRGSIKLSDLEGYNLSQTYEKHSIAVSDNCPDYEVSGIHVYWPEEDLFSDMTDISLDFLKNIQLNDLTEILQKYTQSSGTELPEINTSKLPNVQDAREFGGFYADLVRHDPSLNDALVKMFNLDKILSTKTKEAEEFLNNKDNDRSSVNDQRKTCRKIYRKSARPIRPLTNAGERKNVKFPLRKVKSAKNAEMDGSFEEFSMDDNENPITFTEEEQIRLEKLLADDNHKPQDNDCLIPMEGFLLGPDAAKELESIDSELQLLQLPDYSAPSQARCLQEGDSIVECMKDKSSASKNKKWQMFHENKLLKEIDAKLDVLQRNKNKKERLVSEKELEKLLQPFMKSSETQNDDKISNIENAVKPIDDWVAIFD